MVAAVAGANTSDLVGQLNRERPDVLHILGDGDGAGVAPPQTVLAHLLRDLDQPPRVLIVTASRPLADPHTILEWVEVLVYVPQIDKNLNGSAFPAFFCLALCEGIDVDTSFRQALVLTQLNDATYWRGREPLILSRAGASIRFRLLSNPDQVSVDIARAKPERLVFRERGLGRNFLKRDYAAFAKNLERAAIIFLDVEGMNRINDRFGRALGDRVLAEILTLIEDNASSALACGICGDDTFFVVVDSDDRQHVIAVGRGLMTAIEGQQWTRLAHDLYVRVEGGFAIWNVREGASDTILRAGEALRIAQTEGRRLGEAPNDVAKRLRGKPIKRRNKRKIPEETMKQIFS